MIVTTEKKYHDTHRDPRPAPDALLREALDTCAKLPCIREFWGAARPCPEYDDGRELCGPCKAREALAATPPASAEQQLCGEYSESHSVEYRCVDPPHQGLITGHHFVALDVWQKLATPPASAERDAVEGVCPECGKVHWHYLNATEVRISRTGFTASEAAGLAAATPPASAERDAGAGAVITPECRAYSEHYRCSGCACDCHDRAAEARE